MRGIEILPTNTCPPDLEELGRRTEQFAAFAPSVQLDVSDGVFSPVTSWPYFEGQSVQELPLADRVEYEVHLMVRDPEEIGIQLIAGKAKRVLGHIEALASAESAHHTLRAWKEAGARAVGLAALFDTPLSDLESVIQSCDVIQLMTIPRIGAQGAPFADGAIERVAELRARHPELLIEVDGGVSEANVADLVRAGVRRFGVGSAISKAADPKAAYESLRELAERAL